MRLDRPWVWLALGWRDVARAPQVSLLYGAALVPASLALAVGLSAAGMFYLILPLACGFMLVGPLVAVGLYEVSRRLAAGEPVSLGAAVRAYSRNAVQLSLVGLILALALLFWVRTALLLFALFFGLQPPVDLRGFIDLVLFSTAGLPFLAVGTLAGGAIAAAVFAISAVSVPMLLDRDCDVFTAVVTSIRAVTLNWRAMTGWAALIALFTAAGLSTAFIGLALAMPLIAHASWHAYKDLVAD
ncbi:DUF2189 domain-containing protein [Arenibaculum pallidiluteum]|uniref:DUF2189 domain-containing protein n=1 Tax=Arenibaculum pallidiluteum TaxID=2812559 RepID=UPI002E2AD8E6|nr:DUF2189 domain-containing protein [Arenibaculum pallidiluteum]